MPEKTGKKQRIAAVICELNPLHFGHEALFRQAKRHAQGLVCILSGNFVQRGEPAVLDKWARCRLALGAGADLVLELPLPWACARAERFAAGGVHLAAALGNVDFLVFGSELDDGPMLKRIAEMLLSTEFSQGLSALPDRGEPFARRREMVLTDLLGPEVLPFLRSPNAVLGIEYQKALLREKSEIKPLIFPRQGTGHDREGREGEFFSAGQLRELLRAGKELTGLVPDHTADLLREQEALGLCPLRPELLERSVLCKLRSMRREEFSLLPDLSEGLENRLFEASRRAGSLEELYSLVKSKRYSHARIRRLVLSAFLGITNDLPALPPYLRVLGMKKAGEGILKEASLTLPLAARPAEFQKTGGDALRLFQLEAAADDLCGLAAPTPWPCGRDYTEKVLKL